MVSPHLGYLDQRTKNSDLRALLVLIALTLLFFFPAATLQGVYFYGDALDYNARLAYTVSQLRAGQIALWNPFLSFGGTHAGDPAGLAWYLPALLLFLVLPFPLAVNFTVILHILLAAVGLFFLARAWGLSIVAALLGGILYAFSGFAIAHLQHLNILIGLAWLPVLVWCVERILKSPSILYVALGSIVLALQLLGGHIQIVLYGALVWGTYAIVYLVRLFREHDTKHLFKTVSALVLMCIGGAALAAVFLIPFIELLNFTLRGDVTFEYATSFSLEPLRLVTFFQPYFYGGNPGTVEHGVGSLVEMSAYISIMGLALVPLAYLKRDWRVYFLSALAGGAFVLALGKFTPFYQLVYSLPLFGTVRAPARFLVVLVLALALLASYGLDALRAHPNKKGIIVVLVGLGAALLGTGGVLVASRLGMVLPNSLARASGNSVLWFGLLATVAAMILLVLWGFRIFSVRILTFLTVALVVADLGFFAVNFRYNFLSPVSIYLQPGANAGELSKTPNGRFYYAAAGAEKQSSLLQQGNLDAYLDVSGATLRESMPLRFGLHGSQGYGSESPFLLQLLAAMDSSQDVLLDLAPRLGIGYILSGKDLNAPALVPVSTQAGVTLYRLPDLGRARIWYAAQSVPDQSTAFDALTGPGRNANTLVLEAPIATLPGCDSCSSHVTFLVDEPGRVVIETQTSAPGYLELLDTFYPGWHARVDNQPVEIIRADALFRAVPVPAGIHNIEFVYEPSSLTIGALVSGISLIVVVTFLVLSYLLASRPKNPGLPSEKN